MDFLSVEIKPYQFEPVRKQASQPVQNTDSSSEDDDNSEMSDARLTNTDWCKCGNCGIMSTLQECICCAELSLPESRLGDECCISSNESFQTVCLNQDVLDITLIRLHDVRRDNIVYPHDNRTYRWAAYTQFIYWSYGRLGKGNRRVVPSCVVQHIRRKYPEPSGIYVGFKDCEQPFLA
ncbi:P2X purinoceptor 7-like [Ptychodera flava]|uniref:P2X purinoceptor 7-like n=1 Tax=Ptychodera flava TaxID=63121 RepID=UPI00396A70D1